MFRLTVEYTYEAERGSRPIAPCHSVTLAQFSSIVVYHWRGCVEHSYASESMVEVAREESNAPALAWRILRSGSLLPAVIRAASHTTFVAHNHVFFSL